MSGGFRLLSLCLLLVITMTACERTSKSPIYSHFEVLPHADWDMDSEVFFSFPIEDTSATYSITGVLRIGPQCRLKALPVGIVKERPDGETTTATIRCPLTAENAESRGFNIREYEFSIDDAKQFGGRGIYTYSFRHLLQDSIASGIVEVGLMVTPIRP